MKKLLYCLLCILPLSLMAQHLLLSEVVLQPSAGEYVKITNPTSGTVNLSDYYITDATDTAEGEYYYNLPSDADYWSGDGSDFIARFPDMDLAAGESIILGLGRTSDYNSQYGVNPDISLKDDMLPAVSGASTIGGSPNAKLENTAEALILFTWDGAAATVTDVDYLIWGSTLCAVDKSGISTYAADTPVASQAVASVHVDDEKLVRVSQTEGTETQAGGNGIDGDDETSENLDVTWQVQDLASNKPVIAAITITPSTYYTTDTLTLSTEVTDAQGGLIVECVYTFDGTETVEDMTAAGDVFTCQILPLGAEGTLSYYVRAENAGGLKDSSLIASVEITVEEEVLTIREIRDNFDTYNGESVTVTGIITVERGKISPYSGYMQDNSGRGMNVYGDVIAGYARGSKLRVTGDMTLYGDIVELSATSVVDLGADALPDPVELTCAQVASSFEEYEGTLVNIHGLVTSRTDYETASNVYVDDGTGSTTLRIWTSTGVVSDATADSLLQGGISVDVNAICSFYNGAAQVLPAYASDVSAWTAGEAGDSTFGLTVAAFPFAPKLGEVISYHYKYPEDVRVTLRVYDASGRHVTTLVEKYHGMSWQYDGTWNGKDDLGRYVRPGMYIMHLEMIERTTGVRLTDAKPVVIAVTN